MVDLDLSARGIPGSLDKLGPGRKTVIAGNLGEVDAMMDVAWGAREEFQYPESIACWNCEAILPLAPHSVTWPIGDLNYYFPRVPSYQCGSCDVTFFPEVVREALAWMIETDKSTRALEKPVMDERTREFYRIYRNSVPSGTAS